MKWLAAFVWVLSAGACRGKAGVQTIDAGRTQQPLEMVLSADGAVLKVGLRNTGTGPQGVLRGIGADFDFLTVRLRDEGGQERELRFISPRDRVGPRIVDLGRGETTTLDCDLPRWALRVANGEQALLPGRYSVWATYALAPEKTWSVPPAQWTGRLHAGPIVVEVPPAH